MSFWGEQLSYQGGGDVVSLTPHSQVAGPGSSARFRLTNAGLAEGSDNGGANWTSYSPEWLQPPDGAAGYEVECVVNSGTLTSGPSGVGVWSDLGTTRTWIRNTPGGGSLTVNFTLSIRRISTTQVLTQAVIDLTGSN